MGKRGLAILAITVVLLLLFIWFYERKLPSTDELEEKKNLILDLKAEDIDSIKLTKGKEFIQINKIKKGEDEKWMITKPLDYPASGWEVDSFINNIVNMRKIREVELSRGEIGIEERNITITISSKDGTQATIRFGKKVPGGGIFVEVNGRKYAVEDTLSGDLEKDLKEWRSKDILPFSSFEIARITFSFPNGNKILLAKKDDKFWIESPITDLADEDKVQSLKTTLGTLQVKEFLDNYKKEIAKVATVEIVNDKNESFTLEVAESPKEETLLAKFRNQVVEIPVDIKEFLETPVENWRSKKPLLPERYSISKIEIEKGEEKISLVKKENEWTINNSKIEFSKVNELLDKLEEEALEILDKEPKELQQIYTIKLTDEEGKNFKLTISKDTGYAILKSEGRKAILKYPASYIQDLEKIISKLENNKSENDKKP